LLTRRKFVGSAAAPFAPAGAARRPNPLLILTDQQNHSALYRADNPWLKTPAMDSPAASGVRFAETICHYPVCSPSRGSLFTGRMPHETGVRVNGQAIVAGMTVCGGKWHRPNSFDRMTGFEKLIGGSAQGGDMDVPLASTCAKWLRGACKAPFPMLASFMNAHDIREWIRSHPGTHDYPGIDRYPSAPGNMAANPNEPEFIQYHRSAGIDEMSEGVGVAAAWQRDDVRKYLAAHHGEMMGAHGLMAKQVMYEESVRVPLLIGAPFRRIQPHSVAQPVSHIDLAPTVLEMLGHKNHGLPGRSLVPVLGGQARSGDDVFLEWTADKSDSGDGPNGRTVITPDGFRLVLYDSDQSMLFDRAKDSQELNNVYGTPAYTAVQSRLRKKIEQWQHETKDEMALPAA
jgi:choline-sulfatase